MQMFISNVSRTPHTRSLRMSARGVKPRRVFMLGGRKINPTNNMKTGLQPLSLAELSTYWPQIEAGLRSGQIVILDGRKQMMKLEVLKGLATSAKPGASMSVSPPEEHDKEIRKVDDEQVEPKTKPAEVRLLVDDAPVPVLEAVVADPVPPLEESIPEAPAVVPPPAPVEPDPDLPSSGADPEMAAAVELMAGSISEIQEVLGGETEYGFLKVCLQAEQNKDKPRKTLIKWIEERMDKVSG